MLRTFQAEGSVRLQKVRWGWSTCRDDIAPEKHVEILKNNTLKKEPREDDEIHMVTREWREAGNNKPFVFSEELLTNVLFVPLNWLY